MAGAQPHYASASLYVGDLDPEVNETTLFEVFSAIGPVASIRVCRETGTRRSLGYAYVNYHSISDAERSLDTLNYTPIKGTPCRIMWSHRDPSLRKSGNGNVFVKNLDKMVDNKSLHDTFSLFGNILSCKISYDEYGKSRGYGFIHYETDEAARAAIAKVNGMQIGSKPVYVGPFKKHLERPDSRGSHFTNLYVKQFPAEWTEEKLKTIFGDIGAVTSMVVSVDPKGRRFAMVNYETTESAKKAVEELHCRRIDVDGLLPAESPEEKAAVEAALAKKEEAKQEAKQQVEATAAAAAAAAAGKKDESSDATAATTTVETPDGETAAAAPAADSADSTAAAAAAVPVEGTKEEEKKSKTDADAAAAEGDDDTTATATAAAVVSPTTAEETIIIEVPRLYVVRAMSRMERISQLKESFNVSKEGKNNTTLGGNLYVKNLDDAATDEDLRVEFSKFGTVTSAKVMRDETTGMSKGFGFVCFAFPEEATKAVTGMHLKVFLNKPLYVGLAERKDSRIARLQQRYRMSRPAGQPHMMSAGQQQQQPIHSGGGVPPAAAANMVPFNGGPPGAGSNMYYGGGGGPQRQMMGHHQQQQQGVPGGSYMGGPGDGNQSAWRQSQQQQPPHHHQGGGGRYGGGNGPMVPAYPYQMQQQQQGGMGGGPGGAGGPVPVRAGGPNGGNRGGGGMRVQGGPMVQQQQQQGAGAGGFKFTPQARNRHDFQQMAPQAQMVGGGGDGIMVSDVPLSASSLALVHPQMQKQMLGERLFPLVHKHQPELAGKITGMMLEMDNAELLSLLDSDALLQAKVDEALGVLHRHRQGGAAPSLAAVATATGGPMMPPQSAAAAVGGGGGAMPAM